MFLSIRYLIYYLYLLFFLHRCKYFFEKGNVIGLEVGNATSDDAGEYKCVCFNDSGKVECKSTVSIQGKNNSDNVLKFLKQNAFSSISLLICYFCNYST